MYVERLLQINMAALAALATLLLGMGNRSAVLPVVVMLAAIASVWLTDVTGRLRLSRNVANGAALVAALYWLPGLWQLEGTSQILAIANLLVYLQIILLFQKKDIRTYWHLAVLSLLQVVVAAAFNQGFWFGVLLTVYLFGGMSVLTLLFLHRERNRYDAHRGAAGEGPAGRPPDVASAPGRWPLADRQPVFSVSAGGRLGVDRELYRRLGVMTAGTLILTGIVFLTVPRLGRTAWRGAAPSPQRVVGFSQEVALGSLGEIIEDPGEVMRIQLLDDCTGDVDPLRDEVYLHGTVLTTYSHGHWKCRGPAGGRGVEGLHVPDVLPDQELVRQRITVEPLDSDELFCVWPFVNTQPNEDLICDYSRGRLYRREHVSGIRFSFELGTTAVADGVQTALVPNKEPITGLCQLPKTDGATDLPNLTALADRWIARSGLPPEDRIGRAKHLQRQLRDSGRFQYSLEGPPRDLSIDPIEDFVTNNPRGHCEFFATALTLMLRTQGIPSRVVVGYKSDEWNSVGNFFQVRQLHAHAWLEAYLEPRHIPPELFDRRRPHQWSGGGWLRLDPTAASFGDAAPAGAWLAPVGKLFQRIEFLWANYVMEMNRFRQRRAIYEPLVRSMRSAVRSLRDPNWWRGLLEKITAPFDFRLWKVDQWFSFRGGLAAMVAAGLLVLAYWSGRFLMRSVFARLTGNADSATRRPRATVAFYRRLENLLRKRGLVRSASRTQHEFAAAAGAHIAKSTGDDQLAALPDRVVEAFYRVRFGGFTLDTQQAQAVEHALHQLQQAAGGRR